MTPPFDPSQIEITPVSDEEMKRLQKGEEPREAPKKEAKKKSKKITYVKSRYSRNPVSKVINKGIIDGANSTILRDKNKKLGKEDSDVGEALMYIVDYYAAIDINHPALVMLSAIMGVSFTIIEYSQEPDITTEGKRKDDVEPDVKEVAK